MIALAASSSMPRALGRSTASTRCITCSTMACGPSAVGARGAELINHVDHLIAAEQQEDWLSVGGGLVEEVRADRAGVVVTMRSYPVVHARELLVRVAEPT